MVIGRASVSLIEKWKTSLNKKGCGGAILLDLSKAFYTINYELLLEKLHAYDFTKYAFKTIHNYLKNRYQRIKINKVFSSWCKIFSRVPQGSVLRPLVFNIYLKDMIFLAEKTDICNFAEDTTFHAYDSSLDSLAKRLIMKVIKMPEFLFS